MSTAFTSAHTFHSPTHYDVFDPSCDVFELNIVNSVPLLLGYLAGSPVDWMALCERGEMYEEIRDLWQWNVDKLGNGPRDREGIRRALGNCIRSRPETVHYRKAFQAIEHAYPEIARFLVSAKMNRPKHQVFNAIKALTQYILEDRVLARAKSEFPDDFPFVDNDSIVVRRDMVQSVSGMIKDEFATLGMNPMIDTCPLWT